MIVGERNARAGPFRFFSQFNRSFLTSGHGNIGLISSIDIETPEFARDAFSAIRRRKNAMKTMEWMFGVCVLVALPIGIAEAGQCTAEIENMTKLLASRDAGSGPTAGAATSTTIGQHPPSAAMGAADPSTTASSAAAESGRPQHPPTAAMNEATRGGGASSPADSAREQHPPTAAMGEATRGGATSAQDVQSQMRGGPTAAQQAEGARRPASENLGAAQAALNEARGFDQSGNESACMEAIQRAKRVGG
jgi:hypothetical protein